MLPARISFSHIRLSGKGVAREFYTCACLNKPSPYEQQPSSRSSRESNPATPRAPWTREKSPHLRTSRSLLQHSETQETRGWKGGNQRAEPPRPFERRGQRHERFEEGSTYLVNDFRTKKSTNGRNVRNTTPGRTDPSASQDVRTRATSTMSFELDVRDLDGPVDPEDADRKRRDRNKTDKQKSSQEYQRPRKRPAYQEEWQMKGAVRQKPKQKSTKEGTREGQIERLRTLELPSAISIERLASLVNIRLRRLQAIMEAMEFGNTNPDRTLTFDDASLVALELGYDPIIDEEAAFDIYPDHAPVEQSSFPLRPPIVTIMGHVDHGKTSLLDALRNASVAPGEAGGITQHTGAFEVGLTTIRNNLDQDTSSAQTQSPETITFLDTPGHAAFAAMRSRGASVTDIAVLVVAADDGVKPQTEEVIGLLQREKNTLDGVGIVVAITKIDKQNADVPAAKRDLQARGVLLEEFGGEIPCVEVSSVTKEGLVELAETLVAVAEVREIRAQRMGSKVHGQVLESDKQKETGVVSTMLVLRGILRPGSVLVSGRTWCRVRVLVSSSGQSLDVAYPGQPVKVIGWREVPSAGDQVLEAKSEEDAKKAIANRARRAQREHLLSTLQVVQERRRQDAENLEQRKARRKLAKQMGLTPADIAAQELDRVWAEREAEAGKTKELRLVIKADYSGTAEAIAEALKDIGNEEARVRLIFVGVGDITTSDVQMAAATEGSPGCIIGFNVCLSREAAMESNTVPIHIDSVIYRLIDQVRADVVAMLPKHYGTKTVAEADVLQTFNYNVKGRQFTKIAGCRIVNGTMERSAKVKVFREGETIFDGIFDSMKHHKKDVTEVKKGSECGVSLANFDGFQAGDKIITYSKYEIPRQL